MRIVILNDGLMEIEAWEFYGCTSLERFVIPPAVVRAIKEGTFMNCLDLTTVILDDGLKVIEQGKRQIGSSWS